MAAATTPEELDAILSELLNPNTIAIKLAEERLKEISKSPSSTMALVDRIANSASPQVRQLAAVIARRKCVRHWGMAQPEQHTQMKAALLHVLAHEAEHLVRRSAADLVSAIAKVALPAGQWDDLLQWLFECSQSQHGEHREVALVVFASLTDTIGDQLRPHFQQLVQIFVRGLTDSVPSVRTAALKGVGALIQWMESKQDLAVGAQLLPPILEVSKQCIDSGDDDTAMYAFEMLIEAIDSSFGFLAEHLPTIVKFMLEIATAATKAEVGIREKAMMFVTELAAYKAKLLKKRHMVPMILQATFELASEPDHDDADEDDTPPYRWGTMALDMLSLNLPSRQIVPSVIQHVSAGISSQDKFQRRGAVWCLGTCAEGCSESFTEQLETILPWVQKSLVDPEQVVRHAACWTLVQFSEFLQPEIVEHHDKMLPGILVALEDQDPETRKRACFALEAFAENMEDDLEQYVESLMAKMGQLLEGTDYEMKSYAMSAIASIAGACGEQFKTYYHATMQKISEAMTITDDEGLSLRARATECGGLLATAVGRELFDHDRAGFVQLAMAGLALDSNELREYTYGTFSNLAGIYKEEMAELMPSLLPAMLQSCDSDDGVQNITEKGDSQFAGIGADSDDEEEDDVNAITVRTAWLDEKAAAVHAIGAIADGMGPTFEPYLERALESMNKLESYFHEDVRQNVQTTMSKLFMVSFRTHTQPMRETAGEVADQILHPHTSLMMDTVMRQWLGTIKADEDKETVAQACEAVASIAPEVKGFCFQKYMQEVMTSVKTLFEGKATCQEDGDEEPDEEDDEDHDQVLIDAVAELLGVLGKVYGQAFTPFFEGIFPALQKYLKPNRQASDRLMAIGAIADVCSNLGEACLPYIQPMLPILASGLKDENAGVRRNSVFCCGVFCLAAPQSMNPYVMQIVAGIQPLLSEDEADEVRDNAVGALSRIITGDPNAVPTAQMVGVLAESLPLVGDDDENQVVVQCLLVVYKSMPEALNPYLGKIVAAFVGLIAEEPKAKKLKEETREGAKEFIGHLCQEYAEPMGNVINSLPDNHKAWVSANIPV